MLVRRLSTLPFARPSYGPRRALVTVCAAACLVALPGCQTPDPYTGEERASNTAVGGGIGAVAGAAVGALVDGRRGALVGAGIGALNGAAVGNYMDRQEAALRSRLTDTGVTVARKGNRLLLEMPGDITFASGSAELSARVEPVLGSIASVLDEYEQTYVDVVGHTDSTGGDALNERLSRRRAESVARNLRDSGDVLPDRIVTEGRGESRPTATNTTARGRALNRRVEIELTPVT